MNWPMVEYYAKGIWAVAGPLVGVLIGAYIADRNKRKQWIADNKKEEYRAVLLAMNKTVAAYANVKLNGHQLAEWHDANPEIRVALVETVESSIFIAAVLTNLDLDKRFFDALEDLKENSDFPQFLLKADGLSRELLDAASLDIGI